MTAASQSEFLFRVAAGKRVLAVSVVALAFLVQPGSPALALPPPFMFSGPVAYGVGASPSGVAACDVDRDGHMDVLTANAGAASITVRRGNGDGTFAAASGFAVGASPLGIVCADFDGDGAPDVATANSGDASVTVLMGHGDGTFGSRHELGTGLQPRALAVADFDGDTKPDLVVANSGSNTVSVLYGSGDGQFTLVQTCATGTQPYGVAVGDFDLDGHPDLAVSNHGATAISVLRNAGDGSFLPRADWEAADGASGVTAADLNADGRPDLAVITDYSCTTKVRLGNGDGTFAAAATYWPGCYGHAIAAGDLNGDARLDLASVVESGELTILPGLADGTMGNRTTCAIGGSSTAALAIADFDENGSPDVVTANRWSNSVAVYLNASVYGQPLALVLVSAPNPSQYGEAVYCFAYVTPDTATGVVELRDRDSTLISAPITSGYVRFPTVTPHAGRRVMTARYPANERYPETTSQLLVQTVNGVWVNVGVTSSRNPSPYGQPIHFDATVTPQTTSYGTPRGTVVFLADWDTLAPPVPLVAGTARSPDLFDLGVGQHNIIAIYQPADTLVFAWNGGGIEQTIGPPIQTSVTDDPSTLRFTAHAVSPARAGEMHLWVRSQDRRDLELELLDVGGRRLARVALAVEPGERTYLVPAVGALEPGIYLFRVVGARTPMLKVAVIAR